MSIVISNLFIRLMNINIYCVEEQVHNTTSFVAVIMTNLGHYHADYRLTVIMTNPGHYHTDYRLTVIMTNPGTLSYRLSPHCYHD